MITFDKLNIMVKSKKEKISFNENLEALEEIISTLRSGELQLEDSLEEYSKGVKILSELKKQLNESEIEIEELMGELQNSELNDDYDDISHA